MDRSKENELYNKCMVYLTDQKAEKLEIYKKCIVYLANRMDLDGYTEKYKLEMKGYLTNLRKLMLEEEV
jgi:hypothetical protein